MGKQATAGTGFSRRQFLRLAGGAMGGAALVGCAGARPALAASVDNPDEAPGILLDITRCVGCGNCQRSCIEANDLHPAPDQLNRLTSQTYTYVQRFDVAGKTRFVKRQCMQCLHPACAAACTVGALHQTEDGIVVIDSGKCIGCRYCQYACPFNVPTFDWQSTLGVISKCQFCIQRLRAGQGPACTTNCPSGALTYGKRADLLRIAHARLAGRPDVYVDHIYGETEVGGTTRMYISDVPFEELGLPQLGSEPAPRYAEAVMARTPTIAISVAAAATVIYSALKRKGGQEAGIEVEAKERKP